MFLLLSTRKKKLQMRKLKLFGLLMGGLLIIMTSCLRGDDGIGIDDWLLGNAQISSFSLSNDSIIGLSTVKFTIDQVNGKIFNKDSMPYGTVIDEKVLCTIEYDEVSLGVLGVFFVSHAGDTVRSTTDSIDFSGPVTITVYPFDGLTTKTYEAKINIHQVNPDTMVFSKYSDILSGIPVQDMKVISYQDSYCMYVSERGEYNLYKSDKTDMINWKKETLSGFPADAVDRKSVV